MKHKTAAHYNEKYFDYQAPIGEFGGWANLPKFEKFVEPDFSVIDFGCGGGYLLSNVNCQHKIGIEINENARKVAAENGIHAVATAADIDDDWADLIISNHALEHVSNPLETLSALRRTLKPGGRIVFVVPCESFKYAWKPNDVNHHLYTWSPMCLGNLFLDAGFDVEESKPYFHQWPPKRYRKIAHIGGRRVFDFCCRIYSHWDRTCFQVRLIGHRPSQQQMVAA